MKPAHSHVRASLLLLLPMVGLFIADAAPTGQTRIAVVMSGLDNPRGLALARDGTLYVAEAGKGGIGPCAPTGRPFPEDVACAGRTGAISRLRRGVQRRIVTGLPSAAPQTLNGEGATGPHDVSLRGNGDMYVTLGLGGARNIGLRSARTSGGSYGSMSTVAAGRESPTSPATSLRRIPAAARLTAIPMALGSRSGPGADSSSTQVATPSWACRRAGG
jgi:hypothetical protein